MSRKRLSAKNNKELIKKSKREQTESSDSSNSTDDYDDDYNYSSDDDNIVLVKKSTQKKKAKKAIVSDTDSSDSSNVSDDSDTNDSESDSESSAEIIKQKTPDSVVAKKMIKNSNEIFKELIKKQLPDVPSQWKLNINDIKRICKYIDTSIFDKNTCCMWNGYITNMNNSNKGTYVNFYFRNKKVALHRLLYSNFVAPLDSSEYLKFNCDNKGICCNINHYEKYKYSKNNTNIAKKEKKRKEPKKDIKEITIIGSDDPDKLIINFD